MILFSLFNILANFQENINKILAKKFNIFIIIYLDNIFIYSQNTSLNYIIVI